MTIAFGAAGANTPGTTSLAIPYPTGITAGQMLLMFICSKYPSNFPTKPTGWDAPANNQFSDSGGSPAADTGNATITLFTRIADGTETGNVSVTLTGVNTCMGIILRYTKTVWTWDIACAGGADASAGTSWSVTAGSDPGVTTNDLVVVGTALNGNTDTATSEAISQTGVTYGAMAERADAGTNNGDDCSLVVSEHPVTAGPSSAAPVFTATIGGTGSATARGASIFVRLRETPKAPPPFHRPSRYVDRRF